MMSGARAVDHASRVHPERKQKTVGEDANRDSLCFLVDVETCSVRPSEQSRRCCKSRGEAPITCIPISGLDVRVMAPAKRHYIPRRSDGCIS